MQPQHGDGGAEAARVAISRWLAQRPLHTQQRPTHTWRHPPLSSSVLIIAWCSCLLLLVVSSDLILPVDGATATVCLASNCLLASPTFDEVFSDYLVPEIGYYFPTTLFHFFIAIVVIIIAVWMTFWFIAARQVYRLGFALSQDRVILLPAIWASARHSITRDVIAQWMVRHVEPPAPVNVQKIPILVHFPMSSARLFVNPTPIAPTISPRPRPPPTPPQYTLKLVVSTVPNHACLVEVWFGVPLKTVALFLSDFTKFKARHSLKPKKAKTKRNGITAVTPLAVQTGETEMKMAPPSRGIAVGQTSRPSPEGTAFLAPQRGHPQSNPNAIQDSPPLSPYLASHSGGSRVTTPRLHVQTASPLPGTTASRRNSPSHVTAESENHHFSQHISHLSFKERGGSASAVGSHRGGMMAQLGTGLVLGLVPPPPPGAPVPPRATLQPDEGSQLFLPREALFALPPTLYPSGSKQTLHLQFPQAWLRDTLAEPSRCPIVIFMSAHDETSVVSLDSSTSIVGGEVTIVQFSPPSQSPGTVAKTSASALPAPAITQQQAEPDEAKDDDEPDGKDESPAADEEPLSPSVQSPTSSNQDAITSRVRFDRQLILTADQAYEMEELYGMDESDAECIICLTDIRDVILLPCKHVCVCQGCFKSINKCPICRSRIHSHMVFIKPEEKPVPPPIQTEEPPPVEAPAPPVAPPPVPDGPPPWPSA